MAAGNLSLRLVAGETARERFAEIEPHDGGSKAAVGAGKIMFTINIFRLDRDKSGNINNQPA